MEITAGAAQAAEQIGEKEKARPLLRQADRANGEGRRLTQRARPIARISCRRGCNDATAQRDGIPQVGLNSKVWACSNSAGRKIERITSSQLRRNFPAWNAERYRDGLSDPVLFP